MNFYLCWRMKKLFKGEIIYIVPPPIDHVTDKDSGDEDGDVDINDLLGQQMP